MIGIIILVVFSVSLGMHFQKSFGTAEIEYRDVPIPQSESEYLKDQYNYNEAYEDLSII